MVLSCDESIVVCVVSYIYIYMYIYIYRHGIESHVRLSRVDMVNEN